MVERDAVVDSSLALGSLLLGLGGRRRWRGFRVRRDRNRRYHGWLQSGELILSLLEIAFVACALLVELGRAGERCHHLLEVEDSGRLGGVVSWGRGDRGSAFGSHSRGRRCDDGTTRHEQLAALGEQAGV